MPEMPDRMKTTVMQEIAIIRSGSLEERRKAVKRLSEPGEEILPEIIEALTIAESNDERWYLASALVRIKRPLALTDAMRKQKDPDVRKYLAAALGEMGEIAVEPLISLFKENSPELRGLASLALCRIGGPAISSLQKHLHDPETMVSSCCSMTLLRLGEPGIDVVVHDEQDSSE